MAERDGSYYIKECKKHPDLVTVKNGGNGDHVKFYANVPIPENLRNPQVCPYNLKGNGTEYAIVKWLKAVGVLLTLVTIAIGVSYFFLYA